MPPVRTRISKRRWLPLSKKPRLVITDSQAFGRVSKNTPDDILLTSFSILFARYKGSLETLVRGAAKLSKLKAGDKVLISEGCTHHRQCNDIGTVKMPGWIEQFSGIKPEYVFSSGNGFPDDLSEFALIVHCGGCMLNEKEMQYRIARANEAGVPIVNYGVAIAEMHGILRAVWRSFRRFWKFKPMIYETSLYSDIFLLNNKQICCIIYMFAKVSAYHGFDAPIFAATSVC